MVRFIINSVLIYVLIICSGVDGNDDSIKTRVEKGLIWLCSKQREEGYWEDSIQDNKSDIYEQRLYTTVTCLMVLTEYDGLGEYKNSYFRGIRWLLSKQQKDGRWSNRDDINGMCVYLLAESYISIFSPIIDEEISEVDVFRSADIGARYILDRLDNLCNKGERYIYENIKDMLWMSYGLGAWWLAEKELRHKLLGSYLKSIINKDKVNKVLKKVKDKINKVVDKRYKNIDGFIKRFHLICKKRYGDSRILYKEEILRLLIFLLLKDYNISTEEMLILQRDIYGIKDKLNSYVFFCLGLLCCSNPSKSVWKYYRCYIVENMFDREKRDKISDWALFYGSMILYVNRYRYKYNLKR